MKILMLDDNIVNGSILITSAIKLGYDILKANNGKMVWIFFTQRLMKIQNLGNTFCQYDNYNKLVNFIIY